MEGRQVLEAAEACQALLGRAAGQDWTRPIPELDWTVAEAVGHMAGSGFAAMACDELLVHTDDAARGLGVPFTPPDGLVLATLTRLFPWAPGTDPWPALLWCNGRVALPGLPRQSRWAWHCAPLEEWDGLNPADRR
jgi:hypothetical protein